MSIQSVTTAKSFADLYEARKTELPGAKLPWLAELRQRAAARLTDLGLPTSKLEQWRYTPALANRLGGVTLAEPPADAAVSPALLPDADLSIALVDGRVQGALTASPALAVQGLGERLAAGKGLEARLAEQLEGSAFAALNLALLEDGLFLEASASEVPQCLEIDYRSRQGLANPYLDLTVKPGAELILLERFSGDAGLSNQVARIALEAGARLTHLVLLEEGAEATHLSEARVRLDRDARYATYLFYGGSGLSRRDLEVVLAERGAEAAVDGAYLLDGAAHGDLTSHIRHAAPDTTSRETVKGALAGSARQVFRGKITVEAGSARADGRMANKTLLLSDKAEIDSKPELMIFHDEVQCAHGATSGKLDEDALFYLRSRGLPEPAARNLLLRSFLEETLERLTEPSLTHLVAGRLDRRLEEIAA